MFITFEGGEGAGKSTLIRGLEKEFRMSGREVIVTREPGGTALGDYIRNCLLNPDFGIAYGPHAELMLFLASRAQHLDEVIRPALKQGKIVLCDRFNDSTVAYQGGGRGLGIDYVHRLCDLICGDTVPDITLFLDVDPAIGMSRIQLQRDSDEAARPSDRLESEKSEFHRKVRETFYLLAQRHPKRIRVIDASGSADEVLKTALKLIYDK